MKRKTKVLAIPWVFYLIISVSLICEIECGFSGGAAALLIDALFYPIDTLKTCIQASGWKVKYREIWSKTKFYAGLGPACAASIPANFAFFWTYEKLNSNLHPMCIFFNILQSLDEKHGINSKYKWLLFVPSAIISEFVELIVRTPFEVVKQNRQFHEFNSTKKALQQIWKLRGIKGFYAGFAATFCRQIPYSIFEFGIYEYLMQGKLYFQN